MTDRLLTPRQAAEKLGISRTTLYHWAYERRLPTVKLFGAALRFRESDLDKLIAVSVRPALRDRPLSAVAGGRR